MNTEDKLFNILKNGDEITSFTFMKMTLSMSCREYIRNLRKKGFQIDFEWRINPRTKTRYGVWSFTFDDLLKAHL